MTIHKDKVIRVDYSVAKTVGYAINLIVQNYFLEKAVNYWLYEAHKNHSNHCKYKRMINRGELRND